MKHNSNANEKYVEPIPQWSTTKKRVVSLLVLIHLTAIMIAPLGLDAGYSSLLRPFGVLREYNNLVYMNHGYRFFAPDPGPTHTIRYEAKTENGELIQGKLPDPNETWPRLLYHRWFMLGETIANEVNFLVIGGPSFMDSQRELEQQIAAYKKDGRHLDAVNATEIKVANEQQYESRKQVLQTLTEGLKKNLKERLNVSEVRIFSQRRLIPLPRDVISGISLEDERNAEEIELTDLSKVLPPMITESTEVITSEEEFDQ